MANVNLTVPPMDKKHKSDSRESEFAPLKQSVEKGSKQNLTIYESIDNLLLVADDDVIAISTRNRKCLPAKLEKLWCWVCSLKYTSRLLALFALLVISHIIFHSFESNQISHNSVISQEPFSTLHPVNDLDLSNYIRPTVSSPPMIFEQQGLAQSQRLPLPTNSWYQNMLLPKGEPDFLQRVYTIPYLLDVVGSIPGLRIHPTHVDSTGSVMQVSVLEEHAITLGISKKATTKNNFTNKYSVVSMSDLGLTLKWDAFPMESPIVRGMPYATMLYETSKNDVMVPTIRSEIALRNKPIVDGKEALTCGSQELQPVLVKSEVELSFQDSDFTWLVFVSEPVWIQCFADDATGTTMLQVVERDSSSAHELVVRVALANSCTSGSNHFFCSQSNSHDAMREEGYATILRNYAHLYPGKNTEFSYELDEEKSEALMVFNWDTQNMLSMGKESKTPSPVSEKLIMYALPHHLDILESSAYDEKGRYCVNTLIPACLVVGSPWMLLEDLPQVSFRAPRPPRPQFLPALADALKDDIGFTLPDYYRHGAGDTYFSGKMLAKHGRILVAAEELLEICGRNDNIRHKADNYQKEDYKKVCNNLSLPSNEEFAESLDSLRSEVEIWINGTAETPFVYDSLWGGVVSCGCWFNGHGCVNSFPECPAFIDPGLNFGNGFYNDHHFHYGYHIYAAAVVAHFDPVWGKEQFERVLMLIRNIANPSLEDIHFPTFRNKDWYMGSSWASGIALPPYLNGKNQESSSEAIASYEAIALYGDVMFHAWEESNSMEKASVARNVRNVGKLLTATEVRSAQRYWQVHQNDEALSIYPDVYKANVVGIMWSTMAQFQTWFGNAPYLVYGIQLVPLTPISEDRDNIDWVKEMYPSYAPSCEANENCAADGWSVPQLAMLATLGYAERAVEEAQGLPEDAFLKPGGNGHSLSNTIWYIATRPQVDAPIELKKPESRNNAKSRDPFTAMDVIDCYTPDTCTNAVLTTVAGTHSCLDRILWLTRAFGKNQRDACAQVAEEYPDECGLCSPGEVEEDSGCPPCSDEQCTTYANECPSSEFSICTKGTAQGGCSNEAWAIGGVECEACCMLSGCANPHEEIDSSIDQAADNRGESEETKICPACSPAQCESYSDSCPSKSFSVCTDGRAEGGCSVGVWTLDEIECGACCDLIGCTQYAA